MIISKTPLRISFFSGGSDMASFYEKEDGAALSVTIDKFIYVSSHITPYSGVKTMYDNVYTSPTIRSMQNGITKAVLKSFDIPPQITISSVSDIMAKGSGLGSSSAFTVGLIKNMITHYKPDEYPSAVKIAEYAYNIEHDCGYPVGKQDQYAAAYGGFNLFNFKQGGYVTRTELPMTDNILKLQDKLLLVYSGKDRVNNKVLKKQSIAALDNDKFELIKKTRDKAYLGFKLLEANKLDEFGMLLHVAWSDKKKVVKEISDDYFDFVYRRAMDAGVLGGKLLGAGGGGFFIFYVPEEHREGVKYALTKDTDCKIYDFKFHEKDVNSLVEL